jgi:hypothetical protein
MPGNLSPNTAWCVLKIIPSTSTSTPAQTAEPAVRPVTPHRVICGVRASARDGGRASSAQRLTCACGIPSVPPAPTIAAGRGMARAGGGRAGFACWWKSSPDTPQKRPIKTAGQAGQAGQAVEQGRKSARSRTCTMPVPPGWKWRIRSGTRLSSRPMAGERCVR